MRRDSRQGASTTASVRGAHALVCLPLGLAAFALLLQFSSRSPGAQPVALPGISGEVSVNHERARFMQMPGSALSRAGSSLAHLLGADREYTAQNPQVPKDWQLGAGYEPHVPEGGHETDLPKLAFLTTTADSFRQIQLWTQYHRALGVSIFYLFVDGQAARPDVMAQLQQLPGVRVVPKTPELRYKQEHSRIWNETWLAAFFHKPCNHELFVQQSLNMEEGIKLAHADGADWVLHIDTDELMYPGGAPHYSLQAILADVPRSVDTLVFPNYESMPERDDVTDPFTQVTLFKRNFHHVTSTAYFQSYKSVTRGNPNYFITYGNGKSAARVQRGLRPNGAHRWFNYFKHPREVTHETAAVLHFTYNRFSDLKSRRDRCDCAPTEADAKRCFILPFDRLAFLAASLKTDGELLTWFRQRLVWNDPEQVKALVKNGLFYRIYTPQVLIRGFISMNERAAAGAIGLNPAVTHGKEVLQRAVAPLRAAARHWQKGGALVSDAGSGGSSSGPGARGGDGGSADSTSGTGSSARVSEDGATSLPPIAALELADTLQTGSVDGVQVSDLATAGEDSSGGHFSGGAQRGARLDAALSDGGSSSSGGSGLVGGDGFGAIERRSA